MTYRGVVVCDNAAASFNTRRALEMSPTRDGRREGTNVSTDATGAIDTWTVCASISSLPSWMNYTSGGCNRTRFQTSIHNITINQRTHITINENERFDRSQLERKEGGGRREGGKKVNKLNKEKKKERDVP